MPNKNYLRGRRFEYETVKRWTGDSQWKAVRTAGSHGEFDVVVYTQDDLQERLRESQHPVSATEIRRGYEYRTYVTPIVGYGIQCKVRKRRAGKIR